MRTVLCTLRMLWLKTFRWRHNGTVYEERDWRLRFFNWSSHTIRNVPVHSYIYSSTHPFIHVYHSVVCHNHNTWLNNECVAPVAIDLLCWRFWCHWCHWCHKHKLSCHASQVSSQHRPRVLVQSATSCVVNPLTIQYSSKLNLLIDLSQFKLKWPLTWDM